MTQESLTIKTAEQQSDSHQLSIYQQFADSNSNFRVKFQYRITMPKSSTMINKQRSSTDSQF